MWLRLCSSGICVGLERTTMPTPRANRYGYTPSPWCTPRLHELRQLILDHLLEIAALEVDEEEGFLVVLAHVEAHEVRLTHDLLRRLLEGHVQRLFALLDPFHEELDRKGGFARPARAEDHHGR